MAATPAKLNQSNEQTQQQQKPKIELAKSNANNEEDVHCRTFIFNNEDHTIGNSLKHIISKYPEVEFCAYNTPHPLEDHILFHIQTKRTSRITAVDVLRRGLEELEYIFQQMQSGFEVALSSKMDNGS